MNEEVQNPIQANTVQQNNNNVQPITVPLQIQPVIQQPTQTSSLSNVPNVQTVETQQEAPQPVQYQQPVQQQQSIQQTQTQSYTPFTVKRIDTSQFDTNTLDGQYKSAYANTINQLLNEMLINRTFQYNPNEDTALQQALEYSKRNTINEMNSRGILNSTITAERISKAAMELSAKYYDLAQEDFYKQMNLISSIANLYMDMDKTQFAYWQDARDQQWKEKMQAYQEKQDEIKNAWNRVDALGYVDNKASTVLGVRVGTLSKNAREAKEAYERELEIMQRKATIEYETEKKLAEVKNEMQKDLIKYEYNYSNKTNSTSKANNVNLSTYDSIIQNRWANYDEFTRKYTVDSSANDEIYNYLMSEYDAGRLNSNDAASLVAKYNITQPGEDTAKKERLEYLRQLANYSK